MTHTINKRMATLALAMGLPPALVLLDTARTRAGRFGGSIRATLWPTRAFAGGVRWFDELYVWTEGAAPTVTQRARIQINAGAEW